MILFEKILSFKFLILIVLFAGAFMRLYRLPQTMQFLGDQGRDAIIARRILVEHHPALIGPVTSVGNMYLGPFYYYFMVFPLMLTYPSPTGPAFAVAVVGIATLYLVYRLGKQFTNAVTALVAMALYAISPMVITQVRFSWNPNIVPFFSLFFIWLLYQAKEGKHKYWAFLGLVFAILMQLHYITLALGAIAGVIWLLELKRQWSAKQIDKKFLFFTGVAAFIFLLSLTPLVIFDIRQPYSNVDAFKGFLFSDKEKHFSLSSSFSGYFTLLWRTTFGLFVQRSQVWLQTMGGIGVLGFCLWSFRNTSNKAWKFILTIYLTSVFILSLYRSQIFDHYLGFLLPMGILILATIISTLWSRARLKLLTVVILVFFAVFAIKDFPGSQNLGLNIFMMQRTADEIYSHVKGNEKYDILLLSDTHDFQGMNYRYFLENKPNKPATEEEVHSFTKLFVLDEMHQEQPLDTPQYKIAIWPNRTVVEEFTISRGPSVLMLEK